jgi:lipopolysaccharide biosynthesis glycosyltransferase
MKKKLFFEYCEFLFSVLAEFEKRKSVDAYSVEGKRTLGHLGERLFGAYYTYLKTHAKISCRDKQLIMFQHTEKDEKLFPAFSENNIGIVFAANESYSPFTSAAIQSVIDHSRNDNNYDIIILSKDMPGKCKNMLSRQIAVKTNFSIRFYDVGSLFFGYNLFERPTISVETYYRLAVPEILSGYGKIVYLDSDLIVKTDIADLYATELGNNFLAGVIDVANSGCINGFDSQYADYYNIRLKMQNAYMMINMGVIVMNCELFRKKYDTQYLLEFAQQGNFKFQDQDLLNIVCEGKIKYLNPEWNFFADPIKSYRGWIETFAPAEQYTAYLKAKNNIKILHFAGNEKPWKYATCDYEYADEFWTEFIKTPFYGAFMLRHSIDDKYMPEQKLKKKNPIRRLADLILPKGTRRRAFFKNYYHKIKNKFC